MRSGKLNGSKPDSREQEGILIRIEQEKIKDNFEWIYFDNKIKEKLIITGLLHIF